MNNLIFRLLKDTYVDYLYEQLNIPLAEAGVKVSSSDLSNQWHELLLHYEEFLSLDVPEYIHENLARKF